MMYGIQLQVIQLAMTVQLLPETVSLPKGLLVGRKKHEQNADETKLPKQCGMITSKGDVQWRTMV